MYFSFVFRNEQNPIPNFRLKQEKIITLKYVRKNLNIVMIYLTIFNTFARKIQSSIICCSSQIGPYVKNVLFLSFRV